MSIEPPEKFAFLPHILTGCRTCLDTHSARPRRAAETAPGRTQDPGSPPPRLSPACCDDCSPASAWPLRRAVSASRSRDCRRWLVAHPEAFIYEPVGNKRRLVGVEYIVDAATWLKTTTTFRRFSTSMPSNSLARRTASIWTPSSSCTCGPGAAMPGRVRELEQQRDLRASINRFQTSVLRFRICNPRSDICLGGHFCFQEFATGRGGAIFGHSSEPRRNKSRLRIYI